MIYAIGDIHGRHDLAIKLYSLILADIEKIKDSNGSIIIFLGDMIDRGPYSKDVLDFLMNIQDTDTLKHIILMGNHELMMYDAWQGIYPNTFTMWTHNGGVQTLKNFGLPIESIKGNAILAPYIEWIRDLPIHYSLYDYIFCHSGFIRTDFNIPLDAQSDNLLWGRPHKGMYVGFDKWIIHGHTPLDGKPEKDVNRVNVDIGCGHPGYNSLCCVVLPHGSCTDDQIRFIQT